MQLNRYGLTIPKATLTPDKLSNIKQELTVKPAVHPDYNSKIEPYPLFKETPQDITVPRYYARNTLKIDIPDINEPTVATNIQFRGNLRDKQPEIAESCLNSIRQTGGGIISLHCGAGKCLAKNTPVLMYDGSIKLVQNIVKDDLLMGPNALPRKVLSLAYGVDKMYNVIPHYNGKLLHSSKYTVNKDHILSLKHGNSIFDMSVITYINYGYVANGYREALGRTKENIKLYKKLINKYGVKNKDDITLDFIKVCQRTTFNFDSLKVFIYSLGYYIIDTTLTTFTITKDLFLEYNITIEFAGVNMYYGFEIDGDRRFLLGDYTVTHNTVLGLWISAELKEKTLIVVHKEFLMSQWIERIQQYTNARIGVIQQKRIDVKDKDIVIGMIQSISQINYDSKIFDGFGLVIYDEGHHAASKVYSRSLQKIGTKYTIALSATPFRLDGLTKVLYWYIGPIIYRLVRKGENRVYVKSINYNTDNKLYKNLTHKLKGKVKPNHQRMITNMYKIKERDQFIIKIINYVKSLPDRKILVLSGRLEHLKTLKDGTDKLIQKEEEQEEHKFTTAYYVGGMKPEKLQESSEANIIFATFNMAEEGLDIGDLNTLIFATPKKNVEQAAGRIIRKTIQDGDICPMIIDIVDNLVGFNGWTKKRDEFFASQSYTIHRSMANNTDFIDLKHYLITQDVEVDDDVTDEKIRELYIKNEYGDDYYDLLEEIDFKDEPVEKYVYDTDINKILETPYERIEININNIENDNNPDNAAPIIDEDDDMLLHATRLRLGYKE